MLQHTSLPLSGVRQTSLSRPPILDHDAVQQMAKDKLNNTNVVADHVQECGMILRKAQFEFKELCRKGLSNEVLYGKDQEADGVFVKARDSIFEKPTKIVHGPEKFSTEIEYMRFWWWRLIDHLKNDKASRQRTDVKNARAIVSPNKEWVHRARRYAYRSTAGPRRIITPLLVESGNALIWQKASTHNIFV